MFHYAVDNGYVLDPGTGHASWAIAIFKPVPRLWLWITCYLIDTDPRCPMSMHLLPHDRTYTMFQRCYLSVNNNTLMLKSVVWGRSYGGRYRKGSWYVTILYYNYQTWGFVTAIFLWLIEPNCRHKRRVTYSFDLPNLVLALQARSRVPKHALLLLRRNLTLVPHHDNNTLGPSSVRNIVNSEIIELIS